MSEKASWSASAAASASASLEPGETTSVTSEEKVAFEEKIKVLEGKVQVRPLLPLRATCTDDVSRN